MSVVLVLLGLLLISFSLVKQLLPPGTVVVPIGAILPTMAKSLVEGKQTCYRIGTALNYPAIRVSD